MKKCPTCGKQYEDANTLCPADGTVLKRDGNEDALVGQLLHGKYRIEEKIDEGGMGCVYRATHVLMEKTVAIKVLHPALAADDKIVQRFTREARAASRISHPHAIVVTDFGEAEGGVVYLVMEYLRGRTLKDVVRGEGPLPLGRVVNIVRQVSGALEAAHAEGVVHRDLKSDNIMLEEASGGGDWAKVLDFGIAKIQQEVGKTDPALTAPNLIIGTPQYMSPEQCSQASGIDRRSDIYSLGVIVYEMLVGHVPFTGDSPTAIMMKHLQEPPPSVLDERKDLPAGVGRVIARALAKRPEDRFQKAGELADALAAEAAQGGPLTAAELRAIETDRIVVPTAPVEPPRTTASEDLDEATVVSADYDRRDASGERLPPPVAPLPESSFNPWRVAVPAIAALLIVFAVVFAFQRRGASGEEPTDQPLTTDPNSQPVQSITPPTGQAEQNLVPVGATPTPGSPAVGELPGATDPNANAAASPSPAPEGESQNANQSEANANSGEEDEPEEKPTPTPPKRLPNVNLSTGDEAPPPPKPRPKPKPEASKPPAGESSGPLVPDPNTTGNN